MGEVKVATYRIRTIAGGEECDEMFTSNLTVALKEALERCDRPAVALISGGGYTVYPSHCIECVKVTKSEVGGE